MGKPVVDLSNVPSKTLSTPRWSLGVEIDSSSKVRVNLDAQTDLHEFPNHTAQLLGRADRSLETVVEAASDHLAAQVRSAVDREMERRHRARERSAVKVDGSPGRRSTLSHYKRRRGTRGFRYR